MINGIYYNPTAIFFGKGMESKVGEEVAKYSQKVLLHFGCASFKKNGLYDKVVAFLKAAGASFVELGGVKPNPRAGLVYEGIEICRKEGIDFILAVGGGSVIDSAKAISIGVPWKGDFFDFFEGTAVPEKALKVGTILTVPGSGSESSTAAVITHEEKGRKKDYANPMMAPVFSILNPEVTCTLSEAQTACGIVDAISHVLERYFTNTLYVDCTDRIGESLLKTLMKYAVLVRKEPDNYDVRAEIMWACKLAHDNTAGFGRKQDWSSHWIAHEIGAVYDAPHGAILGVVFPAWMEFVHKENEQRFLQLAERVFDIDTGFIGSEEAVDLAIGKFKKFLKDIGMPTTLRELGIKDKTRFAEMSEKCVIGMKSGTIGNFVSLPSADIMKILEIAY
ncbi:MAG: iron-containing alcohol dehydrogenase [Sedimentisphaerales bacterium]